MLGLANVQKIARKSLREFVSEFSEVSKRGWREGVGDKQAPKKFSRTSPNGGIGKRVQKRGLNLWHMKDFLGPTPSVRQPLFETSEIFPANFLALFLQGLRPPKNSRPKFTL